MNEDEVEQKNLKKMATLLREGATMLQSQCPVCDSPLFKLRNGDLICPVCQKPVITVKDDSEIAGIYLQNVLFDLSSTIGEKIRKLNTEIQNETDQGELMDKTRLLLIYLEAIERINRIKKDKSDQPS